MKFMIAWKIPPGCYKPAMEAFLSGGAPVPPGLKTDSSALAQPAAEWANVCGLEISPVIEDAEAVTGLSKVFKK